MVDIVCINNTWTLLRKEFISNSLEIGKIYKGIIISDDILFIINGGFLCPRDTFITLSEFRENKINQIINENNSNQNSF